MQDVCPQECQPKRFQKQETDEEIRFLEYIKETSYRVFSFMPTI